MFQSLYNYLDFLENKMEMQIVMIDENRRPKSKQCNRRVNMYDWLYIPKNILKYVCDALFFSLPMFLTVPMIFFQDSNCFYKKYVFPLVFGGFFH